MSEPVAKPPRDEPRVVVVTTRMAQSLVDAAERRAAREGLPRSGLIEKAVRDYLSR